VSGSNPDARAFVTRIQELSPYAAYLVVDKCFSQLAAAIDAANDRARRLNRRCGKYEAAIAEKLEKHTGPNLGRALANAAATMYRGRNRELAALLVDIALPALADECRCSSDAVEKCGPCRDAARIMAALERNS